MMRAGIAILLLSMTGCDALPRDPEGTLNRIERSRQLRVGIVAMPPSGRGVAAALLDRIESRTGAIARHDVLAADPALAALVAGRLDLVIGPFARETPWAKDVAFAPPIATAAADDDDAIEIKAAVRNGENRWLMLVERASRDVAPR